MRINCLAFAQLLSPEGDYCILLNRGRLKYRGEHIMSPIGGSLKVAGEGRAALQRLGAYDFGENHDLIFRVPDSSVSEVISWFQGRTGRETSVLRELREELIGEAGILSREDLRSATQKPLGFARYDATTPRDVPERKTAYLIERYAVQVSRPTMGSLVAAAGLARSQRQVYFAGRAEILACRTHDGINIGPITRHIL